MNGTPEARGSAAAKLRVWIRLAAWTAVAGACVGLTRWQIANRARLGDVLTDNALRPEDHRAILLSMLAGAAATALAVAVVLGLRLRKGSDLRRATDGPVRVLAASALAVLGPALLEKSIWVRAPFTMYALLAALLAGWMVLIRGRAGRLPSPSRLRVALPPWVWTALVLLLVVAYTAYFSHFTILRHQQLDSRTFDLGVFDDAFRQTLHGRFLNSSHYGNLPLFSRHFSPIYALWFPPYALAPRPETLLVVQSAFVALAALPLFFLARRLLRSSPAALVIAFCWLIHPANHGPNFYDVHEMASFPLFVLLVFFFWETDRRVAMLLALLGALAVKEDVALVMLFVAAFIAATRRQYRLAGIVVAVSVAWYVLAQQIIVWSGGGQHSSERYAYYYEQLVGFREGPLGVLSTLVTNPVFALSTVLTADKIQFVVQLAMPLLFLPFVRRAYLLLFVYPAGITLLATRPYLHQIGFQYTWYWLPFLFVALLYALRRIDRGKLLPTLRTRPVLAALLLSSFVFSWQYGAIFARERFKGGFDWVDFTMGAGDRKRLQSLQAMIARIPEDASVSGSEMLIPHVPRLRRRVALRVPQFTAEYLLLFEYDYDALRARHPRVAAAYVPIERRYGIYLMRRRGARRAGESQSQTIAD